MKKITIILLSVLLAASFSGCDKIGNDSSKTTAESSTEKTTESETSTETESEPAKTYKKIPIETNKTEITKIDSTSDAPNSSQNSSLSSSQIQSESDSESQQEESIPDDDSEEIIDNDDSAGNSEYESIAATLYQNGLSMYTQVFFSCPYSLDYDNMDANGNVAISDTSVTDVDDIASAYCTVFAEPDSYIYERYTESDGTVYCNVGGRGSNIYYTGTDLEFVSGDETNMTFNAVSHYSDPETGEKLEDKVAPFSITLTENGYRITQFDYPE